MKAMIDLNALIVVVAVTAMAVISSIALAQQPAPDVAHRQLHPQRASAMTSALTPPMTPAQRVARFEAADTDHDGLLSREEAAAGLPRVARHFDEIDLTGSGRVSFSQIEAHVLRRSAWRAASVGPMT